MGKYVDLCSMQKIVLDMYMTAGVGVAALLLGMFLTRKVRFLKRLCIPAPVSGGLLVSLLTLAVHSLAGVGFEFDGTVRDIFTANMIASPGGRYDFSVTSLLRMTIGTSSNEDT